MKNKLRIDPNQSPAKSPLLSPGLTKMPTKKKTDDLFMLKSAAINPIPVDMKRQKMKKVTSYQAIQNVNEVPSDIEN